MSESSAKPSSALPECKTPQQRILSAALGPPSAAQLPIGTDRRFHDGIRCDTDSSLHKTTAFRGASLSLSISCQELGMMHRSWELIHNRKPAVDTRSRLSCRLPSPAYKSATEPCFVGHACGHAGAWQGYLFAKAMLPGFLGCSWPADPPVQLPAR